MFDWTDVREFAQEAFAEAFENLGRGKLVQLVYPGPAIPCDCVDPIGRKPANRWIDGSPAPLSGITGCEQCGGSGLKTQETVETLDCQVFEEPAKLRQLPARLVGVDGLIAIKFLKSDAGRFSRADHLRVDGRKYTKDGDATDPYGILTGVYLQVFLRRAT